MKLIDIFNKLANGEEVPHFKINGVEYYIGVHGFIENERGNNVEWWVDKNWLNEEVEWVEEPKKIENKLNKIENLILDNGISVVNVAYKVNEIIDYLNKGDSNE